MVTMLKEQEPDPCPLCDRPNYFPSDHHLVPRSRGGKVTATICADCHKAIHATFTIKELEKAYHTVEALLGHVTFAAQIAFLRKQDPRSRSRMEWTRDRRKKSRRGA